MSNSCNVCYLLRTQSHDDRQIDEWIKADARRQLSQVEGSDLTVDEFMENESSVKKIEPNKKRRQHRRIHQPFLDYCKKLFRNHKDSRVQCGICGNKLSIRDQKQRLNKPRLINHACVHLGKMSFACAHCDNTYTCIQSVASHLKKNHKLNSPGNYIDSSASYEQEILEVLKRCYGNTGSKAIISGTTTRIQGFRHLNTFPLSNFCRKLVKPDKDGNVHCSICGLDLVHRGYSNNYISHAQVHLRKPLFKCRQCHLQFSTKITLSGHLAKVHVLNSCKENYVDMSSNYEKEMMDMLERCFGQQDLVKSEPSDQPKRRLQSQVQLVNDPLSNACRKLFASRPLDARVQCSLCGTEKKVYCQYGPTPTIPSIRFITHALVHLAKPIFKCRLCDRSTLTQSAMQYHLVSFHMVSPLRDNFVDDSSKHQKEIIAMLEKCFINQTNMELPVSGASKKKKGPIASILIQSRAGTDKLLAERNIRCYELTRKFQKSGKITCRVCQLEMVTKSAMRHVIAHLNTVIYYCRLCTHSSTSRRSICRHVKRTHGQQSINQCEDRSNDFHAQLLKLISDCFDWDQESTNEQAKEDHAVRITSQLLGMTRGNDLKAARVLHCYRLGQKNSKDGRISCRVCSAAVVVTSGIGKICCRKVLNHAMLHLKKVHRYECMQCLKTAHNRNTMAKHLKNVHNTDKSDCEDRSDMYHSEIMKILTRCFDWSQK